MTAPLILDRTGRTMPPRTQSALLAIYRETPVETLTCLLGLLGRPGWSVAWLGNDALVSRARSGLVSRWYRETADDVFLMIDADITYTAEDAERIAGAARRTRGIVGGAYVTRDGQHLACRLQPGTRVSFTPDAPLAPITWAATGFMAVHRDVITALVATMPLCEAAWLGTFWYLFQPMTWQNEAGTWEALSEDYAFCQRARDAGFPVHLDPGIALGHLGAKTYTLADLPGVEVHDDEDAPAPAPQLALAGRGGRRGD